MRNGKKHKNLDLILVPLLLLGTAGVIGYAGAREVRYQRKLASPDSTAVHVADSGDTVDKLYHAYAPNWLRLEDWRMRVKKMNNLEDVNRIYMGQKIKVPYWKQDK